jgi:hypothetical protein
MAAQLSFTAMARPQALHRTQAAPRCRLAAAPVAAVAPARELHSSGSGLRLPVRQSRRAQPASGRRQVNGGQVGGMPPHKAAHPATNAKLFDRCRWQCRPAAAATAAALKCLTASWLRCPIVSDWVALPSCLCPDLGSPDEPANTQSVHPELPPRLTFHHLPPSPSPLPPQQIPAVLPMFDGLRYGKNMGRTGVHRLGTTAAAR